MSKSLPMLCQNVDLYRGPYIPTVGLRGHIHAEGLSVEDCVEVFGVMPDKRVEFLGEVRSHVEAVIFDPRQFQYVRAVRAKSSGAPINVWVG